MCRSAISIGGRVFFAALALAGCACIPITAPSPSWLAYEPEDTRIVAVVSPVPAAPCPDDCEPDSKTDPEAYAKWRDDRIARGYR